MPDHVHVFLRIGLGCKLGLTVKTLKDAMGKAIRGSNPGLRVWEPGFFDHLMRSAEDYGEKWAYVRENPVRAKLVDEAEKWPYQGECQVIRW